mgnify:FL=1
MLYINSPQLALLKKLSSTEKIMHESLSPKEKKIAEFLHKNGLITVARKSFPHPNPQTRKIEYSYGEWISISISETGEAYLAERKHLIREKWIPYIITTVISILALMKSYGFGIDDIFIWCMQQLRQLLK